MQSNYVHYNTLTVAMPRDASFHNNNLMFRATRLHFGGREGSLYVLYCKCRTGVRLGEAQGPGKDPG